MRSHSFFSPKVRGTLLILIVSSLAACSLTPGDTVQPTRYDLGPPPVYAKSNPAIPGAVLVPGVRAPAWLDEAHIGYRLLYEDSARAQTYAMSRWAGEPAALITDRLRSRFAAVSAAVLTPGDSVRPDYTLRVELEDFSQRFDAPGQSRGSLRARATLLDARNRKLLAQRVFDVQRPAGSNAQGAVQALSAATDAFLEELVAWSVQTVRSSAAQHGSP